jgi:hypothetical protein
MAKMAIKKDTPKMVLSLYIAIDIDKLFKIIYKNFV